MKRCVVYMYNFLAVYTLIQIVLYIAAHANLYIFREIRNNFNIIWNKYIMCLLNFNFDTLPLFSCITPSWWMTSALYINLFSYRDAYHVIIIYIYCLCLEKCSFVRNVNIHDPLAIITSDETFLRDFQNY